MKHICSLTVNWVSIINERWFKTGHMIFEDLYSKKYNWQFNTRHILLALGLRRKAL
jgi:hypothetical protein